VTTQGAALAALSFFRGYDHRNKLVTRKPAHCQPSG
jgi:hypothetical protein